MGAFGIETLLSEKQLIGAGLVAFGMLFGALSFMLFDPVSPHVLPRSHTEPACLTAVIDHSHHALRS